MDQTIQSVHRCPACDSEAVTFWKEFSSWVCDECSLVIDGQEHIDEDFLDAINNSPSGNQSGETDWKRDVSLEDASEESLIEALKLAESTTENLSLPSETTIRAGEVLSDSWKSNFMHGRSKRDAVGAAVYLATRETECSVPPGPIAEITGISKNKLKQTFLKLKKEVEHQAAPAKPSDYCLYLCDELDVNEATHSAALRLLDNRPTGGGNPVGIAAAAVYLAANDHGFDVTLRELGDITLLAKETVWRQTNSLRD